MNINKWFQTSHIWTLCVGGAFMCTTPKPEEEGKKKKKQSLFPSPFQELLVASLNILQ